MAKATAKATTTPFKAFFDAVSGVVAAWEDYDTDSGNAAFWASVDTLKASQPAKPLGKENFGIHAAAMRFLDEVAEYDSRELVRVGEHPHDRFWSALSAMAEAKPDREPPHPGSVATLIAQGVGQTQICQIWGFVDDAGRPDIETLEKEVEKPGSQTKGHPWAALLKHRAKVSRDYTEYREQFKATQATATAKAKAKESRCPESPEELYRTNVSIDQAAKMLQLDRETVETLFVGFADQGLEKDAVGPMLTKDGEPMTDYDPVAHVPVDTSMPPTVDELAAAEYAALDLADLTELCEAAELPIDGTADELRQRLAEYDAHVMAGM